MNCYFKFFLSILLSATAFPGFASSGSKPVAKLGTQGVALSDLKQCDEYAKKTKNDDSTASIPSQNKCKKKRIIIFSAVAGGGHERVTQALKLYLGDEFIVESKNIYSEVIGHYEPVKVLTCGLANAEKVYNALISRKYYKTLSFIYTCANLYYHYFMNKITQRVKSFLADEKPDLVISVVPLLNNAILNACEQLNLPFLLIPTDLDIKTFVENIKTPRYKKFKIALPFKDAKAELEIARAQISMDRTVVAGFSVCPDFFEKKDIESIKKHYNIPVDKPVILLMLGAMGSDSVVRFMQELGKVKSPAHIIVCLGKREDLAKKVKGLQLPQHISCTIMRFTERISDLMAIADICITKSGSVSFCETVYMNLPVILDATITPLPWEQANHAFVVQHKCGKILNKYEDLAELVDSLLLNPDEIKKYKKLLAEIPKKHAGTELSVLIDQMMK